MMCPSCAGKATQSWIIEDFQYGEGEKAVTLQVTVPVIRCALGCGQFTDHRAEKIREARVTAYLSQQLEDGKDPFHMVPKKLVELIKGMAAFQLSFLFWYHLDALDSA